MAIDLTLNEQQRLIQNSAGELFEAKCTPELIREYVNNRDEEFPLSLWQEMAELGWLMMPFPERYGGLDCSFLDLFALYVEMGRYLVPCPHLDTVVLAGYLINELGSEAQKKDVLPGIGAGNVVVSTAIMEPEGLYGAAGVQLPARVAGNNYVLSGTKVLVSCVESANWLLCAARTEGTEGPEGISLFLVDPSAAGVESEHMPNTAGLPLYSVTLRDVVVAEDRLLGTIGNSWTVLNEAMVRAGVLQSAMVVGAGERVLDLTVDYAKQRSQFGEIIGKHQAVQYLCTDIAIQGHLTHLLTLQAAWRIDSGRDFLREASLANASASRAAAAMPAGAHEVHAGIGFILDYDLQLYTLRCKHWELNLGDSRHYLEQAMDASGL